MYSQTEEERYRHREDYREDRSERIPREGKAAGFLQLRQLRASAFLLRRLAILEFLVIKGVTDTGGFSFQRNYMLANR